MTRTNRTALVFFGILAAVFLVAGLAVAIGGNGPKKPRPVALGGIRLVSVTSCDDLLAWYRGVAQATSTGYLGGGQVMYAEGDKVAAGVATTGAAAVPQAARDSATASNAHSDTNVQERGVDEPDAVKTNGDILLNAAATGTLEIVHVGSGAPSLLSTVTLPQGQTEILLSGNRVLALTTTFRQDPGAAPPQAPGAPGGVRMMMPIRGRQLTVLTSIDITDPSQPHVVDTTEIDGAYRTARAIGTTARVVITTTPQLPQPGPYVYESPDPAVQQQRLEEWKTQAIAAMTLKDWAPAAGGDCSSITRTASPEGLGSTTILTFDLQGKLKQLDSDTIVADAATVYASTKRLFLATSRWSQGVQPSGADQVTTELHSFDITDRNATSYVGSGTVPGYLLNQYSLSERGGHLRIATTQEAPWSEPSGSPATHSSIAVLDEHAQALVEVGRIDGLGVTERIQAVRYIGDIAYVVTFRQKDPLFAIDLSNPAAPRIAGELKIPGYSAYLHPIDDGRLIGVGQDATADGQTLGTQIATFDVHDPSTPTRIDAARVDHATSSVDGDPRAFLWWDATRTVVLPVQIYDPTMMAKPMPACPPNAECLLPPQPPSRPFLGAVAFSIARDGSIVEKGRVTHDGRGAQVDGSYPVIRSLVVGDSLYTISDAGVLKSSLASLTDEGFAQFPAPPQPQPVPMDGGTGVSSGVATPANG